MNGRVPVSDYQPHHVVLDAHETRPEVTEARRLLQSGNNDAAIALLEPLMAEESDDYLIFEVLGVAYAQKNNMTAAVGAFETATHLNPAQPQPHFNLGQARLRTGDRSGAKEAFERSLRVDPTYGKARDALAALLAAEAPPPTP